MSNRHRSPRECAIANCTRPPSWDVRGGWLCNHHCPDSEHGSRQALVHAKLDPGLTDHGALVLHWPFGGPRSVIFEYEDGACVDMQFNHSSHEARLYIALGNGKGRMSMKPEVIAIDRTRLEFTSRTPASPSMPFYLRETFDSARERRDRHAMMRAMHQWHVPEPPKIDEGAELGRLGAALEEIAKR